MSKIYERHPLLTAAGITDWSMEDEFERTAVVSVPNITYQYDEAGQHDTSSFVDWAPLCDETPAIYREWFVKRWTVTGRINGLPDLDGETCYQRMRELVAATLKALPDNPNVLKDAWIVGLSDEMPKEWRAIQEQNRKRIESYLSDQAETARKAQAAKKDNKPTALRSWITERCYNGNENDCSFDRATEYAMPDGSTTVKYACCH